MAVKYELKNGNILKDGHTLFLEDILTDLKRKSYLDSKFKRKSALHINELIRSIEIKGKLIVPIIFLMKKSLKNHFKNKYTGKFEKIKEYKEAYNDIESKCIKCDYVMKSGVSGVFMYDYERLTFILIHENKHSYISNSFQLFKKLHKWGFVDFN